jgi:quinol monooxygenase YgiN
VSTVNVLLRVRPGKRDEFLQTVQSIQEKLKQEETDLTKASLYQDLNDANVFHLIEDWATPEAMERYIRSDRFSVLMGALKVLCSESEVKYQISSGNQGKKVAGA